MPKDIFNKYVSLSKKYFSFGTIINKKTVLSLLILHVLYCFIFFSSLETASGLQMSMVPSQFLVVINDNNDFKSVKNASENGKYVILTFGDIQKTQFTVAKPIMDKYGFKASFFVTCNWVGDDIRMNWEEIKTLYDEGHDINSKSMNRVDFTSLSADEIKYETAESKNCLSQTGIDAKGFAVIRGNAVDNKSVISAISKHYDFAINGFSKLMFLDCRHNGNLTEEERDVFGYADDCRTFTEEGKLTKVNKYSIREASHNNLDRQFGHDKDMIFNEFVNIINSQLQHNNKEGNKTSINAIPIIAYHSIDNNKTTASTDIELFEKEMKYLYDNGFNVITMADLEYDERSISLRSK